jgi:hypothetical protein
MALTNAEKQKRWRERRNELASALIGDAPWIAQQIFYELGAKKTARVVDLLRKRLKQIDPKCELCKGTGTTPIMEIRGPCGGKEGALAMPCPCDPEYTKEVFANGKRWAEEALRNQENNGCALGKQAGLRNDQNLSALDDIPEFLLRTGSAA